MRVIDVILAEVVSFSCTLHLFYVTLRQISRTTLMKRYFAILLLAFLANINTLQANEPLKREFRGAWIQAVNGQFIGMTPAQMQATLTTQLDALQRAGINAIIFQVRPEADALYLSYYEPWSRYLTGEQGAFFEVLHIGKQMARCR